MQLLGAIVLQIDLRVPFRQAVLFAFFEALVCGCWVGDVVVEADLHGGLGLPGRRQIRLPYLLPNRLHRSQF